MNLLIGCAHCQSNGKTADVSLMTSEDEDSLTMDDGD